jgi:hydroxymethylpyrimidine pyrophosphatase-like HAD family hydrolase
MGDNKEVTLDVYNKSTIIKKILKTKSPQLRLAFLDIDFTLSANTKLLPEIRKTLEKRGFSTIFATARTEEMVMSKKTYEKSISENFYRPRPYLLKKGGKFEYIDPKKINANLVDPDIIIGSTGTQILVKQQSGKYLKDNEFFKRLVKAGKSWREDVIEFLQEVDHSEKHFSFAPIEDPVNYYTGKTNVFPPQLRIQVLFTSLQEKRWFLQQLKQRKLLHTLTHGIPSPLFRVIDEANDKNIFSIYLTPPKASKGNAVEHVVKQLVKAVKIKRNTFTKAQVETIIAGDSYTDLGMLLHGALGTISTAILVGGSEVGKVLVASHASSVLTDDLLAVRSRLKPTKKKGHFAYSVPADVYEEKISRTLIIGDAAYPQTIGPETILAHLDTTVEEDHTFFSIKRFNKMVSSIWVYLPVPSFER